MGEPWHADVFEFLDAKKNTGKEENRARDLFFALWIPHLFMKRVEQNGDWTIMAQKLWYAIVESQIETGTPYMLYKDSCNGKSNQQNLGTIKCSNLCTEIVE